MHNLLSKARAELAEECGFRLNFNLHSPCFKGTKQLGFFLRVSGGVFFWLLLSITEVEGSGLCHH